MDAHDPSHSHLIDFPEALEVLFTRLGELKLVLGAGVDQVEQELRAALAARERGNPVAATEHITHAMDRLAALASGGDSQEGAMMRAMVERFREALVRGAMGEAREMADVMRTRSGSTLTPKKER